MDLIANRQLCLDEGVVDVGDAFSIDDEDGRKMMLAGLARERYATPYKYEAKVVVPEVKPAMATPFRDVPDSDQKPPALVALESAVRAVSDVPEDRNTRSKQRRKR